MGSLNPGGVQTYILNVSKYDTIYSIEREVWTLYQKRGLLTNEFLKQRKIIIMSDYSTRSKNWKPYVLWKRLRNIAGFFYFFRFFMKLKRAKPSLIILDEPTRIFNPLHNIKVVKHPRSLEHSCRKITC